MPECIALVADYLRKLRPTFARSTIYHWMKIGHLDNVDLVVVRTLAELADMKLDQFCGDGKVPMSDGDCDDSDEPDG